MPLPADVGEAIVGWIRRGRRGRSRRLFVSVLPPFPRFTSAFLDQERAAQGPRGVRRRAARGKGSLPCLPAFPGHEPAAGRNAAGRHRQHAAPRIGEDDDGLRPARHRGPAPACASPARAAARHGGRIMTSLSTLLSEYLDHRRRFGAGTASASETLKPFVAFADAEGAERITTDLFLRWKAAFGSAGPRTRGPSGSAPCAALQPGCKALTDGTKFRPKGWFGSAARVRGPGSAARRRSGGSWLRRLRCPRGPDCAARPARPCSA